MLSSLRTFENNFNIFQQPIQKLLVLLCIIKLTIIDVIVVVNGLDLSHLNSTKTFQDNDNDDAAALAATEIKEFIKQGNLSEVEIGIIKSDDDLIYVDIGRINATDIIHSQHNKNNSRNNLKQNEQIQTLTTKMIEEDNQKIIEIEKKISTEIDKSSELLSSSNKPVIRKMNDDLIQVSNGTISNQILSDLVIDDDCRSDEEKSEEYKRIEESLKYSTINNQMNVTKIDFSDFIQLIPAVDVKEIFHEYYRKDKEVQRAYTYLKSKDFLELKNKVLAIQEVDIFIKYLRKFGFDIIELIQTIVNLVGDPTDGNDLTINNNNILENKTTEVQVNENTEKLSNVTIGNEPDVRKNSSGNQNTTSTTTSTSTTTTSIVIEYGLHGLIDSILDILPQDQIISLFFEKLETNYEFSNLVNNIGKDEFSRILQRMENSIQLKHLIYTLHNNGVYIERIVDSLKGYFFLGF